MTDIEQLKRDGTAFALREHIIKLRRQIEVSWEPIMNKNKFTRVGQAISTTENILAEMRAALAALQELDPEHK